MNEFFKFCVFRVFCRAYKLENFFLVKFYIFLEKFSPPNCVWVLSIDGFIYLNVYIPSILREQDTRIKSFIFEMNTFIPGIVGFTLILFFQQ